MKRETDGRFICWADPEPDCLTCQSNPYWGKTLSSWERCECVKRRTDFTRSKRAA